MKINNYVLIGLCCSLGSAVTAQTTATLKLDTYKATSPVTLGSVKAAYYKGIPYGSDPQNAFDIFLPESGSATALMVYIHGGGFTAGDKDMPYQNEGNRQMIKSYLEKNIAFATLDYRLLGTGLKGGVLSCLTDSKRALQFIRYHAPQFHLDKSKVMLMGGSAGAGTCLWIGLNDDMADKNNADPVLRESTRVKGMILSNTQATYNLGKWPSMIFGSYASLGFSEAKLLEIVKKDRILDFYGMPSSEQVSLTSPAFMAYGKKVDMLALLSPDDPELYIEMGKIKNEVPKTTVEVNHHPLHGKVLYEEAVKKGVKAEADIPELNFNTTNGETKMQFVARVLARK